MVVGVWIMLVSCLFSVVDCVCCVAFCKDSHEFGVKHFPPREKFQKSRYPPASVAGTHSHQGSYCQNVSKSSILHTQPHDSQLGALPLAEGEGVRSTLFTRLSSQGHLDTWTLGHLDTWTRGHLDPWTRGHLNTWKLGHLYIWTLARTPEIHSKIINNKCY